MISAALENSTRWLRVVLTTGSPEMDFFRPGVRRWEGISLVPPWLAVLLVTGYKISTISLKIWSISYFIKESNLFMNKMSFHFVPWLIIFFTPILWHWIRIHLSNEHLVLYKVYKMCYRCFMSLVSHFPWINVSCLSFPLDKNDMYLSLISLWWKCRWLVSWCS